MTSPLFPDTVGVANVLPLLECPDWLHTRLGPTMSRDGCELSETFLRAAILILRHKPPRHAMVCCDVVDGVLNIFFDIIPLRTDAEHALLASIADVLQELHHRRVAEDVHAQASARPNNGSGFDLPETDHDFDLLGLVTGPRQCEPVRVFRFAEDAEQLEQRVKGRDSDAGRRVAQTLERLALSGLDRPMASPQKEWRVHLDAFAANFPNFTEPIETVIRPHVSLYAAGLPHRLAPILLVGDPGIGKTHFAHALANLLNTPPPLFLCMAAETNASSLAGSSTFWANASPGQLFELLAWGRAGHPPVANSLVILDEIDKCHTGAYSALAPMYSLLEEDTARHFVDQSLPDLTFDASHVRLIATANDLDRVPAALLSRMLVFTIAAPSAAELIGIARQMLGAIARKLALRFSTELPATVEPQIASMSPRSIKLHLEIALARAVLAERDHLLAQDWPSLRKEGQASHRRTTMGFMPN